MHNYDVIIAGGGVIGSSVAYFLAANPDFDGRIAVVERDPCYKGCSTALSAGSIRHQFSAEINIRISQFGTEFLRALDTHLSVAGECPAINFTEGGYLFLATEAGVNALESNHFLQTSLDADIQLLLPDDLRNKFPWLHTDDLVAGSWGASGEGWFDPYSLLQAFRNKARDLGVEYLHDEVAGINKTKDEITGVVTKQKGTLACKHLVNATGPQAKHFMSLLNVNFPVQQRKRCVFVFDCRQPVEGLPLLIDPSGVYVRPEGKQFICGVSPAKDKDPDCDDYQVDYSLFEEIIWPALANRIPAFTAIKQTNAWAGHYAYNVFDQNALVGLHPAFQNLWLANGFSGHGLQQAPAVGRGISEQIVYDEYRSLDLSPLEFDRVLTGKPLFERNIV